ncbi:MAG TPA: formimidoylglutamase [Clostridiales bacterium UBA8960]|nr:formimidoylglutamase [Clostridiales bacterium UBA8960]
MKSRYRSPIMSQWTGRIDSNEQYDAFRWHQWMQPIDLTNDKIELPSYKVGVAFIGFACDEGVRRNLGRTGAAKGPASIRKELCNLPCSFTEALRLFDAGTIICDDGDLEGSQNALSEAVSKLIELNLFPIVLGGGHEVAYGSYAGLLKSGHTPGIINFDAHFDIRPYQDKGSSGTMFRQIYDDLTLLGKPFNYFAVGIQKRGNTVDLFKTADCMRAEYLMAKEIGEGDLSEAYEKLDAFLQRQSQLYVTICTDVFSSAFAPGVSATQPLGLHPERILRVFKRIFATGKVMLFDIAEVSPRFDNDNVTSNLAATFVFAAINSLADYHDISL